MLVKNINHPKFSDMFDQYGFPTNFLPIGAIVFSSSILVQICFLVFKSFIFEKDLSNCSFIISSYIFNFYLSSGCCFRKSSSVMLGPILARFNLSSSSKVKLSESIMVLRRFTFCNNSLYLLLGIQTVESIILLILSLSNINFFTLKLSLYEIIVQIGCVDPTAPPHPAPCAA